MRALLRSTLVVGVCAIMVVLVNYSEREEVISSYARDFDYTVSQLQSNAETPFDALQVPRDGAGYALDIAFDCIVSPMSEARFLLPHEFELFSSATTNDHLIRSYATVDHQTVELHANQGDSAAMFVMALYEADRAVGIEFDGERVVRHRNLRSSWREPPLDSPQGMEHSLASARWLYLAALNGRIMALREYGATLSRRGENAVSLGWMTQDKFDQLAFEQKIAVQPKSLYEALIADIAPGLYEGPLGGKSIPLPDDRLILQIRHALFEEFENALERESLPMPQVAYESFVGYQALNEQSCATAQPRAANVQNRN